jgi:trigger factor
VYKIDDEIVGMKRDEERTIEKTYPADFDNSELAGRSVKLAVKLTKIKEKKLPALDDELAQDVSEKYKTLDGPQGRHPRPAREAPRGQA